MVFSSLTFLLKSSVHHVSRRDNFGRITEATGLSILPALGRFFSPILITSYLTLIFSRLSNLFPNASCSLSAFAYLSPSPDLPTSARFHLVMPTVPLQLEFQPSQFIASRQDSNPSMTKKSIILWVLSSWNTPQEALLHPWTSTKLVFWLPSV